MAFLTVKNNGETTQHRILKRLTSIGSGPDTDIRVKDIKLAAIAAYINQISGAYTLIVPNEKPKFTHQNLLKNKIELKEGDHFTLACTEFIFAANTKATDEEKGDTLAYRRLLEFSQKIACEKDIDTLLKTLLREITQLTGAEHGFLVLIEDGKPRVTAREDMEGNDILDSFGPMSDSIVKSVIEKKEAVIISDALNDEKFSSSLSVINFRLASVMCAPLIYQGHTFGAIYVGNNSFINAFSPKNLEIMTIYSGQAAMLVQNALHINVLKKRTKILQESLELTKFGGIIGACHSMQAVFQQVEKVALTDVGVLICGEAGTGKELIAREIHSRSPRKAGPLVVLNCGAIPETSLESELFGQVRGAFLGATHSRMGKLQAAHNGTLFLDEVDGLPLHMQAKLLTSLQNQSVCRVGDTKSEQVNVRVIAATHRDLLTMVKDVTFREDLYYRLQVLQITIPPLRERGNDVLVIASFYLQKYAKIYGKEIIGIEEEAQNALLTFHWPGNVRQLESRMKRAVVMCDHNRISMRDLDLIADTKPAVLTLSDALERYRTKYISDSLERNAGNRTKTANELGVDPRTIFRHLESLKKGKDEDHF